MQAAAPGQLLMSWMLPLDAGLLDPPATLLPLAEGPFACVLRSQSASCSAR